MHSSFIDWPHDLTARIARDLSPLVDSRGLVINTQGLESVLLRCEDEMFAQARVFVDGLSPKALSEVEDRLLGNVYTYLRAAGILEFTLLKADDSGKSAITVRPLNDQFAWTRKSPGDNEGCLHRLTYVEFLGGSLCLRVPHLPCRVLISDGEVAGQLLEVLVRSREGTGNALRRILAASGFLSLEEPLENQHWELADAIFHFASRTTSHRDRRLGATFRFASYIEAAPARKRAMSLAPIPLEVPALSRRADSLAAIMESRRSNRDFRGPTPNGAQLGELLYRAGHVVETESAGAKPCQYEAVRRPVPSGGGASGLEYYLCTSGSPDLQPGLYHYDAFAHALEPLPSHGNFLSGVLAQAEISCGLSTGPPPVVVILATRLPRVAWKYEGIAYRLALLEAGASLYALSLVATEIGLSSCILGIGDVNLFSIATGLNPYEETSMAEIALGTPGR